VLRFVPIALLGALLAIGTAELGHAAESADLARAVRAYDDGEMDRAERLLRSALLMLYEPRQQAKAWLYLGLVQANRKDLAAARASFATALGFDPSVAPDPDRIPPPVVKEFQAVRESLRGELVVEAKEPKARVFVDGTGSAGTPVTLRLPIGPHKLRVVSSDRYRMFESEVVVTSRSPTRVRAELVPRTGKLQIQVQPPETEIYENGRLVARGADGTTSLPAGPHRFTLRARGYVDASREIAVDPEEARSLQIALQPAPRAWYKRRRPWGWISLGLSGASLVTAILVGRSAQASNDAITTGQANATLDYDRLRVLSSGAHSDVRTANVFFGIAGAAGVTGVLLVLFEGGSEKPPRAWRVLPLPGGVALTRRF
jgi:hypothetical protein